MCLFHRKKKNEEKMSYENDDAHSLTSLAENCGLCGMHACFPRGSCEGRTLLRTDTYNPDIESLEWAARFSGINSPRAMSPLDRVRATFRTEIQSPPLQLREFHEAPDSHLPPPSSPLARQVAIPYARNRVSDDFSARERASAEVFRYVDGAGAPLPGAHPRPPRTPSPKKRSLSPPGAPPRIRRLPGRVLTGKVDVATQTTHE